MTLIKILLFKGGKNLVKYLLKFLVFTLKIIGGTLAVCFVLFVVFMTLSYLLHFLQHVL
jgi:succinate-acetate transporter protein